MPAHPFANARAALATMHGKAQALAGPLHAALGIELVTPPALDTDRFGTFSGEITRAGTMREVAIAKARAGMAAAGLTIGVASEGSFGPHPLIPFVPAGIEIVVLVDDARGWVVMEEFLAPATNFAQLDLAPGADIDGFLDRIGFPAHAVIVRDAGGRAVAKGVQDRAALIDLPAGGRLETDMRAHLNPTRMAAIATLGERFAARLKAQCPGCAAPGWGRVDVRRGRPCAACLAPTAQVVAEVFGCIACDHRDEIAPAGAKAYADPSQCEFCNP